MAALPTKPRSPAPPTCMPPGLQDAMLMVRDDRLTTSGKKLVVNRPFVTRTAMTVSDS